MQETQEIGEVTVSAQKIAKVIRGDTLNILDYEVDGDRLILFASPYKRANDLRDGREPGIPGGYHVGELHLVLRSQFTGK